MQCRGILAVRLCGSYGHPIRGVRFVVRAYYVSTDFSIFYPRGLLQCFHSVRFLYYPHLLWMQQDEKTTLFQTLLSFVFSIVLSSKITTSIEYFTYIYCTYMHTYITLHIAIVSHHLYLFRPGG